MFHLTPVEMEKRTSRQQARVPDFGLGFRKVDVSNSEWFRRLRGHYEEHRNDFVPEPRNPHLVNLDPNKTPSLLYEDREMNDYIHKTLQPLHEQWCGKRLLRTACYGMRAYLSGTYLFNHVDRIETHIISSTLCIHSDLAERWPLYIEDLQGNAHEVDINPGELVFYESAKLKHGRPYDLKGHFYVSQFIHYKLSDQTFTE